LLEKDGVTRVIEAVLYAAGYPVTYEKLSDALGITPSEVKKTVREFAEEYNASPRGIMLLAMEDCCQLCTKEEYAPFIRDVLGIRRGGNLSASSLEVLAIISYNEPVTRSFIDTVRGVDSSYAVTSLCDKGLIEPCGRLDVPGRPMLYHTTGDFLRCFGLGSLEDLPYIKKEKFDENAAFSEARQNMEQLCIDAGYLVINGSAETDGDISDS